MWSSVQQRANLLCGGLAGRPVAGPAVGPRSGSRPGSSKDMTPAEGAGHSALV